MSRITRLLRPDTRRLHWKSAAPVLCLAAALVAGCAQMSTPAAPVRTAAVANFKSCSKPMYPQQSLRDGNTGTVDLLFFVDKEGKVKDSAIRNSSGYAALDEAARTGISKCSFTPATENGMPAEGWMKMRYVWQLHD